MTSAPAKTQSADKQLADKLPVKIGSTSSIVSELQQKLKGLGFDVSADFDGCFKTATKAAVQQFQSDRGLPANGICDLHTWNALIEAGFQLGSRLLVLQVPMLRGDDIAELQQLLSVLGFDVGRIDGIFGDNTAKALGEFQRNAGILVTNTSNPETLTELLRASKKCNLNELASPIRDRFHLLERSKSFENYTVALGNLGGANQLISVVKERIDTAKATVIILDSLSQSTQAHVCNTMNTDVYLGFKINNNPSRAINCTFSYYGNSRYASPGGKKLAEMLSVGVATTLGVKNSFLNTKGMALPILRETRMPAVLCELESFASIDDHLPQLSKTVVVTLADWATCDWT
ncbi:MAG: peptidoglycan-binding protein [Actinobacteria bacterium]|nr:peptidoglycan-binding protein [Actinomycetota bacterium]MCL6104278.1 peptidoglycan-binding protein [Actinomycetota bacterium]